MVWVDKGALAVLSDAAAAALVEGATATRGRVDARVAQQLSSPTAARSAVDARINVRVAAEVAGAVASSSVVKDAAVAAMQTQAVIDQVTWGKGTLPNGDLNTAPAGLWHLSSTGVYSNSPLLAGEAGAFTVDLTAWSGEQTIEVLNSTKRWRRVLASATLLTWRDWERVDAPRRESVPREVAIDTDGTPYFASIGTHQVHLDADGTPVFAAGALVQDDAGVPTLAFAPTDPAPMIESMIAEAVQDPDSTARAEITSIVTDRDRKFNVRDYGAVGDGSTDDLPAFNAAYAAAVAAGGGTIYLPAGRYVLRDEWHIFRPSSPRVDIVIEGQDQLTTFLTAGFYGAGKALVNAKSPSGVRCSPTTLKDFQLNTESIYLGANPVLFEIEGWGESRFDGIRFGSSNNTHWRASSVQNLRGRDITSYYGGKNFNYRSTDGIVFAVDAGTRTITANRDAFQAQDTGMTFFIIPTDNALRIMYTIGDVIGPREARIAPDSRFENHVLDASNCRGGFDAARADMESGSKILTANAAVFSESDVGRVLIVRNARQGAWGPALLRSRIKTRISSTQVELESAATRTVVQTPFAQPVIDFWVDKSIGGMASASSTDLKITDLQVEAYAGLSLSVIDSLQFHMNDMKMHGEHDPVDARTSTGMAWFDDVGGTFSGEFDGGSTSDVRMHFSNFNDTLQIPFLSTRRVWNEPLFQAEEMLENGALIEIGALVSYRHDDHGPADFLIDKNVDAGRDPKIVFTGPVTMVGGNTPPRIYQGMGFWTDTAGRVVMTSPDGTEYRVSVTDAGALEATPL